MKLMLVCSICGTKWWWFRWIENIGFRHIVWNFWVSVRLKVFLCVDEIIKAIYNVDSWKIYSKIVENISSTLSSCWKGYFVECQLQRNCIKWDDRVKWNPNIMAALNDLTNEHRSVFTVSRTLYMQINRWKLKTEKTNTCPNVQYPNTQCPTKHSNR